MASTEHEGVTGNSPRSKFITFVRILCEKPKGEARSQTLTVRGPNGIATFIVERAAPMDSEMSKWICYLLKDQSVYPFAPFENKFSGMHAVFNYDVDEIWSPDPLKDKEIVAKYCYEGQILGVLSNLGGCKGGNVRNPKRNPFILIGPLSQIRRGTYDSVLATVIKGETQISVPREIDTSVVYSGLLGEPRRFMSQIHVEREAKMKARVRGGNYYIIKSGYEKGMVTPSLGGLVQHISAIDHRITAMRPTEMYRMMKRQSNRFDGNSSEEDIEGYYSEFDSEEEENRDRRIGRAQEYEEEEKLNHQQNDPMSYVSVQGYTLYPIKKDREAREKETEKLFKEKVLGEMSTDEEMGIGDFSKKLRDQDDPMDDCVFDDDVNETDKQIFRDNLKKMGATGKDIKEKQTARDAGGRRNDKRKSEEEELEWDDCGLTKYMKKREKKETDYDCCDNNSDDEVPKMEERNYELVEERAYFEDMEEEKKSISKKKKSKKAE